MRHQRRVLVVGLTAGLLFTGIASITIGDSIWGKILGSALVSLGAAIPAWVAIGSAREIRRSLKRLGDLIDGFADANSPQKEVLLIDHRTRAILEALTSLRVGPIAILEEGIRRLASEADRQTDT